MALCRGERHHHHHSAAGGRGHERAPEYLSISPQARERRCLLRAIHRQSRLAIPPCVHVPSRTSWPLWQVGGGFASLVGHYWAGHCRSPPPLSASRVVLVLGNAGTHDRSGASGRPGHGRSLCVSSLDRTVRHGLLGRFRLGEHRSLAAAWLAGPSLAALLALTVALIARSATGATMSRYGRTPSRSPAAIGSLKTTWARPCWIKAKWKTRSCTSARRRAIFPYDPRTYLFIGFYEQKHGHLREAIEQYKRVLTSPRTTFGTTPSCGMTLW